MDTPLIIALIIIFLLSIGIVIALPSLYTQLLFAAFLILGYAYSAPPIRFKSIPFLDSASNILYVIPGFIGYTLVSNNLPNALIVIGAWAWSWAMHLYSAIPDITPDEQAGIRTTAVILGQRSSLLLCICIWSISATVLMRTFTPPISMIGWAYPLIALISLNKPAATLTRYYWRFPLVNTVVGGLITITLLLS